MYVIILINGVDKEPTWLVDIDIDPRAQQMAKMDVSDVEILTNLFDGNIYRVAYRTYINDLTFSQVLLTDSLTINL